MSPMGQLEDNTVVDETDNETTTFNAGTHAHFFNEIFPIFGPDFASWCVCLIADNCSTNKKTASILEKRFVGCNSHKLNLEVNHMEDRHSQLEQTIDSVHGTMKDAKKLRNAALLRNLTDLSPIMHNAIRWSGKLHMLKRFIRIREDLLDVHNSSEGDLVIDASVQLATRGQKCSKMLAEIDIVTKSLQTRGHTLAQCRDDLDILLETVMEQRNIRSSPLYQCKLENKYIAPDAAIVLDPIFESSVVKIQRGLQTELTEDKKESVQCLKQPDTVSEVHAGIASGNVGTGIAARLTKKRKVVMKKEKYMNCDFILGSVAEVERLWSIAKNVLTDNRKSMTPRMFEAIVFLKQNERFWDSQLVSEAIQNARSERIQSRLEQYALEEELMNH
ncbi:Ribonuclease H-like protein [Gracilaria domingensis]|nr:Ribonuclease H-like protein [Gracilaria domingensis]